MIRGTVVAHTMSRGLIMLQTSLWCSLTMLCPHGICDFEPVDCLVFHNATCGPTTKTIEQTARYLYILPWKENASEMLTNGMGMRFCLEKIGKRPRPSPIHDDTERRKRTLNISVETKNRTGKYTSKTLSFNNSLFLPVVNNTKKRKRTLNISVEKKNRKEKSQTRTLSSQFFVPPVYNTKKKKNSLYICWKKNYELFHSKRKEEEDIFTSWSIARVHATDAEQRYDNFGELAIFYKSVCASEYVEFHAL